MKRNKVSLTEEVSKYFEKLRFNKRHHLGMGDIRLTMGQQEEIINIISKGRKDE